MKVLLINGSPKKNGNTSLALQHMTDVFAEQGIESEIIQVGHLDIRGCTCCKGCSKNRKCVIDDIVNEVAEKLRDADGLVIGSPVYFASANGTLVSFLDRLFYSTRFAMQMKVGACVAVARRGGCSSTFDQLNKYFTISGMPVASSHYWNNIHGHQPGEVEQDLEGVAIVRDLAKNMVFLMKAIQLGKEAYGLPEYDAYKPTNFIR